MVGDKGNGPAGAAGSGPSRALQGVIIERNGFVRPSVKGLPPTVPGERPVAREVGGRDPRSEGAP